MTFKMLLFMIPAIFMINMIPGANMVLCVKNTIQFGYVPSIIAVSGRFVSFVVYGTLTGLGLGLIIAESIWAFNIIKYLGVAYLLYLGVKNIKNGVSFDIDGNSEGRQNHSRNNTVKIFKEEAFVALANPKIILIFTALLPQFIEPGANFVQQFTLLTILFCILELVASSVYMLFVLFFAEKFRSAKGQNIASKAIGSFLIAFSVIMATSKQ